MPLIQIPQQPTDQTGLIISSLMLLCIYSHTQMYLPHSTLVCHALFPRILSIFCSFDDCILHSSHFVDYELTKGTSRPRLSSLVNLVINFLINRFITRRERNLWEWYKKNCKSQFLKRGLSLASCETVKQQQQQQLRPHNRKDETSKWGKEIEQLINFSIHGRIHTRSDRTIMSADLQVSLTSRLSTEFRPRMSGSDSFPRWSSIPAIPE